MMISQNPPELPERQVFDYAALDLETRTLVWQKTSELKSLIRRTAQDIVKIGQKLIEVRKRLGYGNFRKWLKAEFAWSHPTATRFIQVAEQFSCINLMQIDIAASALYLLARPSTPEEARQEALDRAALGETITHAAAKGILAQYTVDVTAEVIEDESPTPVEAAPVPEPLSQSKPSDKSSSDTQLPDQLESAEVRGPKPSLGPHENQEGQSEKVGEPLLQKFEVGDRVRILRRQHGGDNWTGKTAGIWQITSDGWLRVAVEGHQGVKFTLKPEWAEPVTEAPEKYKVQPVPVPSDWADESDPKSPEIANVPSEEQKKAVPRFQAGDWLQGTNLGQQNQEWTGEVAEVLEVTATAIKVIVQIPRSSH